MKTMPKNDPFNSGDSSKPKSKRENPKKWEREWVKGIKDKRKTPNGMVGYTKYTGNL